MKIRERKKTPCRREVLSQLQSVCKQGGGCVASEGFKLHHAASRFFNGCTTEYACSKMGVIANSVASPGQFVTLLLLHRVRATRAPLCGCKDSIITRKDGCKRHYTKNPRRRGTGTTGRRRRRTTTRKRAEEQARKPPPRPQGRSVRRPGAVSVETLSDGRAACSAERLSCPRERGQRTDVLALLPGLGPWELR